MLTIGAAFYQLKEGLGAMYDSGEATAIAHAAMEHLTGLSRLRRVSDKNMPLDALVMSAFMEMESALLSGRPLQYVIGNALFMGRIFTVNEAVLIPRPETEELVRWIIKEELSAVQILDIGTGSGCIAISLKRAMPGANVSAIDLSVAALVVAAENASALEVSVSFEHIDFLSAESRDALPPSDVIVSNPPYIPLTERESLHPNVRDHEPAAALFVPGNDALQFYRAIADFGLTHLLPGGSIYCELHRDYAQDALELFRAYGYSDVLLKEDMYGAPRMLRARR